MTLPSDFVRLGEDGKNFTVPALASTGHQQTSLR